ncbi:hypothetical protein OEZ85_013362 [Tetradesmus obliquus]|uniref:EF-hand domain-containing protein n=1 Tax=Tetradesmus obliquus TaxID=3088 RepID=A0ABY8U5H2_TETOB|nr:hypothetical protein OEZ85_013362 [Tetradesmus obliquus]
MRIRGSPIAVVVALACICLALPAAVASSKYACDYRNKLCQWSARFMFGATVLDDKAFFSGGIYSNDATVPVNSTALEMLDLKTLRPYVIETKNNASLFVARYRHQLVTWKGQILAIGGQWDDAFGASRSALNVLGLNPITREWRLIKNFKQPGGASEIIFEASLVMEDSLLMVFVDLQNTQRLYVPLNLTTGEIYFNYVLSEGPVAVPDDTRVSIVMVDDYPLVVTAMRQLQDASENSISWFRVTGAGYSGVEGPLPTSVKAARLKKLSGGSGGMVLQLTTMKVHDKQMMIIWAVADAKGSQPTLAQSNDLSWPIHTISIYEINTKLQGGQLKVGLQLAELLLMLPLGMENTSDSWMLDLPLVGNVQATAEDVTFLPYVGDVFPVGALDATNVYITPWPGMSGNKGFVVRGTAIANYNCQPGATWQPFVLTVELPQASSPVVQVVSNYTWCKEKIAHMAATDIVTDAAYLETNSKLHVLDDTDGATLVVVSAQSMSNPGSQLVFVDKSKPLRGAYIDVARDMVQTFVVTPAPEYKHPVEGARDRPPGLMFHSATVAGLQVMIYGGIRRADTVELSTDLYVLDFSATTPRWRKATVGNMIVKGAYQMDFPNTGIASLPTIGAVVLMNRQGVHLAPMPQSIQVTLSSKDSLSNFGFKSLGLTTGDWVRLQAPDEGLVVSEPLPLMADAIYTWMPASGKGGSAEAPTWRDERAGATASNLFHLRCSTRGSNAVSVWSPGVVLEDIRISGCNGSAVVIQGYSETQFGNTNSNVLRNVQVDNNNGMDGAALHIGARANAGHDGGAVHLAVLSGTATITGGVFQNNSCQGRGGGLSASALDSTLQLLNVSMKANNASRGGAASISSENSQLRIKQSAFLSNRAALRAEDTTRPGLQPSTSFTTGDGGALFFGMGSLNASITNCTFSNNSAAQRGGAISSMALSSNITMNNTTASRNWAGNGSATQQLLGMAQGQQPGQRSEGGALHVGGSTTTLLLRNVTMNSNEAAQGGAVSVSCEHGQVDVKDSRFSLNKGLSAGGAVSVTERKVVVITNTTFTRNELVLPWLATGGAVYCFKCTQVNVTGVRFENNSASYGGGGGLYISTATWFNITGCGFWQNNASSGGGLLADTDACKSACGLRLSNTAISPSNTATGGGSGLFVTNINPRSVKLINCSAGEALNLTTSMSCLQHDNALTEQAAKNTRGLLQAPSGMVEENYLVTSAAKLMCFKLLNVTNSSNVEAAESCSDPLYVAPGSPVTPSFYLVDGLDRNVTPDSRDAHMLFQAQLLHSANGSMAEFMLEGATTRASNGRAVFTGLRVNAEPGGNYTLNFQTESGMSVNRTVKLRGCWAGEYTFSRSTGIKQAIMCGQCTAPQYSFYPSANECGQCLELLLNGYVVCNGPAVVPANGVYQSHPRSPLLHSVLDDDLGVDTSSNPATAPTDASRAPTESSVDDGAAGAAACTAAGQVRRRSFKFWHTDVLIMMVSYMQLLGLLRLIRLNWSQLLWHVLLFMDLTSSTSTWGSLECSFSSSSSLPRSVARSITLLLLPVAALLVLCIYWCCHAAFLSHRRQQAWQLPATSARNWKPVLSYLRPRFVMSCVAMLHFLYTPTSREIVSLFSCQPVDSAAALAAQAPESNNSTEALAALRNTNAWSGWPGSGVWTSDTDVVCGSAVHVGMVVALGVPGLLLFVLGLPLLLWLVLRRYSRVVDGRHMLEDEQVELQFGLVYDQYRLRCYYYECVVLLENCLLTMLLVLLQSQPAALQVLVAMAVIFLETVVHVTLQPYACRMLDSLKRLSVFSLMATLFLLMLVSLSSLDEQDKVNAAAMVGIIFINCVVLLAHLWACGREVWRWAIVSWDKDGKGHLTWQDTAHGVTDVLARVFGSSKLGKMLADKMQALCGVQLMPQQQQQQQQSAARAHGPPVEHAVGSVFTVFPSGQQEVRDGNVLVMHPTPPQQQQHHHQQQQQQQQQQQPQQQSVPGAAVSQALRRGSHELSLFD